MTVEKYDKLNSIERTVLLLKSWMKVKYLINLKKRRPNVEDLEIYEVKLKAEVESTRRIAKIKFEGQNLPNDIRIEGQKRKIRPYRLYQNHYGVNFA